VAVTHAGKTVDFLPKLVEDAISILPEPVLAFLQALFAVNVGSDAMPDDSGR